MVAAGIGVSCCARSGAESGPEARRSGGRGDGSDSADRLHRVNAGTVTVPTGKGAAAKVTGSAEGLCGGSVIHFIDIVMPEPEVSSPSCNACLLNCDAHCAAVLARTPQKEHATLTFFASI